MIYKKNGETFEDYVYDVTAYLQTPMYHMST